MDSILVNIKNENDTIQKIFNNQKDLVSIDDLLDKLEELYWTIENIEDEFEEYKKYVSEYYKSRTDLSNYEIYE